MGTIGRPNTWREEWSSLGVVRWSRVEDKLDGMFRITCSCAGCCGTLSLLLLLLRLLFTLLLLLILLFFFFLRRIQFDVEKSQKKY